MLWLIGGGIALVLSGPSVRRIGRPRTVLVTIALGVVGLLMFTHAGPG